MFVAIDNETKEYVDAYRADKSRQYVCPICDEEIVFKKGDLVTPHFAHKPFSECLDDWSYDMSDWHREWQLQFDECCREVVITNEDGEKHRADIKIGRNIVEFQHSSITKAEFDSRNKFYTDLGYHVYWLFDVDDADIEFLRETKTESLLYSWKNRMRIFDDLNFKYKDHKIHLFLEKSDLEDDLEESDYKILNPVWHIGMSNDSSPGRYNGFSRFISPDIYSEEEFLELVQEDCFLFRYKNNIKQNPFKNNRFGTVLKRRNSDLYDKLISKE